MPRRNQPGCPCCTGPCSCFTGCSDGVIPAADLDMAASPPLFAGFPQQIPTVTLHYSGASTGFAWSGDPTTLLHGLEFGMICGDPPALGYTVTNAGGPNFAFLALRSYSRSPFQAVFAGNVTDNNQTFTITGPPASQHSTTICVKTCGGLPVAGATVTITDPDGNVVATCTTDASGFCGLDLTGTYTVTVTVGGQVVYSRKVKLPGCISVNAGSLAIVCCGGYAIPKQLTLTDAEGSLSFVYYPNAFFPTWFGGHAVQRQSCPVTTPDNVCVVGPRSEGPLKVCYQMVCFAGQNPTFSVRRSWSWVYQQGTLVPIWYQDGSGITPGLPCATGPPAICGSPLTDTAGFTADPSSPSPFMLSGSPVAAPANATRDPIGGGVVISA